MFSELLETRENESPAETQKRVEKNLSIHIKSSNLKWWKFSSELPHDQNYLLVGVASYSLEELNLLDQLNKWIEQHSNEIDVYVYDVALIESADIFEKIYPGIGKVLQTPVVGKWENGGLVSKKWGYDAKVMLSEVMK